MQLILRVVKYMGQPPEEDLTKVFAAEGGTIGRSASNDWILPDPDRFLSSRHAAICFEDDKYLLTDISTNGVFLNDEADPVGNERVVELQSGDLLVMGDYEIAVEIEGEANAYTPPAAAVDPKQYESASPTLLSAGEAVLDPLALLNGLTSEPVPQLPVDSEPAHVPPATERDDAPMLSSHFEPPAVEPAAIPDDWDLGQEPPLASTNRYDRRDGPRFGALDDAEVSGTDPFGPAFGDPIIAGGPTMLIPDDWELDAPDEGPTVAPAPLPPTSLEPVTAITPAAPALPNATVSPAGSGPLLAAFLRGAGLDAQAGADLDPEATLETVGRIVRRMTEDLREVLQARATLKSGFRIEATQLAPSRNNPLKFATGSTTDVLRQLLIEPKSAFLGPEAAVRESFDDIKDHQLALLAGLRASFKALLRQFDPAAIQGKEGGGLLGKKKGAYWDRYCERYRELNEQADDNFYALFGEAFAQAYEAQAAQLRDARDAGTAD